ncbi:MAG TPA: hypothetical protein VKT72_12860 [Candidatus Baltobacteraceae bacterium]|nr:hypothetical protein [Candidatus Baltobacteraceae bacterium]
MRRLYRLLSAPIFIVVGLLLSSCVGAVVQTLVPHDRGAALADFAIQPAAVQAVYAQATATLSTTTSTDQPIPGMAITLPAATTSAHHALVTFSASATIPNSSAACNFTIYNGSSKTSALGTVYNPQVSSSWIPMTMVERIALTSATQKLSVDWNNGGAGTCFIRQFYSLSALLTN